MNINKYCRYHLFLVLKLYAFSPLEIFILTNNAENKLNSLIKEGYKADLLIWDIDSLSEIPYMFDNNRYIHIIKNGEYQTR